MKNIKKRIQQGEAVLGCWLNLGSSVTAEIVGQAGFDWVLIDLEHGAGEEKDVLLQLQALQHSNTAAVVRVESSEPQRIHRVLDMGAEGIMCPHVDDAAEAAKVVSGLRYPPHGTRGVAKMVRATGFGKYFPEYYDKSIENIVGIVQIETPKAVENAAEIAAIDGVDVLFIGPADLSMSMGIFGQLDHPLFKDALKTTIDAAQKAGKATGILLFNPDDFQTYFEMGITVIACGADATFVAEGSRNMINRLNTNKAKSNP